MAVSEFRKAVVKMKTLENKCMLITYSDSMGHNLMDLERVLSGDGKMWKSLRINII